LSAIFVAAKTNGHSTIIRHAPEGGLPETVTFHNLRHTTSTRVMELGTPDEIRDRIFGWGSQAYSLTLQPRNA
jgi:integrase